MGVDIVKMKQKAAEEELEKSQRASFFSYWKARVGKSTLRLMPPWTEEGDNANQFCREVWVHWINKRPYACPAKHPVKAKRAACPIDDLIKHLRTSKAPDDLLLVDDIRAKVAYFSNIVDYADPIFTTLDYENWKAKQLDPKAVCSFKVGDTKVQPYQYGKTIYDTLRTSFDNLSYDFSDINTGHDLWLTRVGTTKENTEYTLQVSPARGAFDFKGGFAPSKLPNLDTIHPYPSYEQLAAAASQILPATQWKSAVVPSLPASQPVDDLPAWAGGNGQPTAPLPAAPVAAAPVVEAPPTCFKDTKTQADTDAMCVGGFSKEDNKQYDACPWLTACRDVRIAAAPPAPSRRRAAPSTPEPATNNGDALLDEIKRAIQ